MYWEARGPGGKRLGPWYMSSSAKIAVPLLVLSIVIGIGGTFLFWQYWHEAVLKGNASQTQAAVDGWVNLGPKDKLITAMAVSAASDNVVYAGNQNELFRSDDRGQTWNRLEFRADSAPSTSGRSSLLLWVSPTEPNFVYSLVSGQVRKTVDGGHSWLTIASPRFGTFAIYPDDPNIIYGGGPNGISKTTDGGQTWVNSSEGLPHAGSVKSIAIDPADSKVAYAGLVGSTSGNMSANIFKTTDGGKSWSPIAGMRRYIGFVESKSTWIYNINSLAANNGHIYAIPSGNLGLYQSSDAGATWRMSPWLDELTKTMVWVDQVATSPVLSSVYTLTRGKVVVNYVDKDVVRYVYAYSPNDREWTRLGDFEQIAPTSLAASSSMVYVGTNSGVFARDIPSDIPHSEP